MEAMGKGQTQMSAAQRRIRMVTEADAEKLLAIYAPYVKETPITFEYEVPSLEEFRERIRRILEKYPYIAAVEGGEIVGYAYASPFKGRAAYDWSVETSVYVKMGRHGEGIGRRLYAVLEEMLKMQHILNANACIAWPHPESERFHETCGYRMAAHFTKCGYKMGKWYDMVWMEKMLGEHSPEPEQVVPVINILESVYGILNK